MRRLHFVNRVDFRNAGDFSCGLPGYLSFGGLKSMHHDIDNVSWNFIRRSDAVIIGASGMLNVADSFNRNIVRLLDTCDTVVGYGIGFNKTPGQEPTKDIVPHLGRFKIIGVRDYNNPQGIRYMPCPSVKLLNGIDERKVTREVGVIHHRDYRLPVTKQFPSIDNSRSIWEVLDFIQSCETVVTSSYHCAYWSQLLGKKVVIDRIFSEKFNYFKHKPVTGISNIEYAKAAPEEFMDECLDLNEQFYLEVCDIIEAKPNFVYDSLDIEARIANLSWRVATLEGIN